MNSKYIWYDIVLLKYTVYFNKRLIKRLYKNNYNIYKTPLNYYINLFSMTLVITQPRVIYEYFKVNNLMYVELSFIEFFDKNITKFVF